MFLVFLMSLNVIFFSLSKISEECFGWCSFIYVSLLFIFQGGFVVHLSGDLRIALAAEVGGIVNLLVMPRTLCSVHVRS